MKQTAIEWLVEQVDIQNIILLKEEIQRAKEMEKQQIVDSYNMATKTKYSIAMRKLGISTQPPLVENAEQYYNETFKKQ